MNNKNSNKNMEKIIKLFLAIVIAVILFILGVTRENVEEIFGAQNDEVKQTSGTQESVSGIQEQTSLYIFSIFSGICCTDFKLLPLGKVASSDTSYIVGR